MTSPNLKKRLGKKIIANKAFQRFAARCIYGIMRFIQWSNRPMAGTPDLNTLEILQSPAILSLWHGQHIMAPCFKPNNLDYVALLSRSRDAAINAHIVEMFGSETVRGSGGRAEGQRTEKGGAQAFLQLKRALDAGKGVVMIADISKSEARQAGKGIIALARASNRPIIPMAYAYSRRKVLEKTWDKTTIPLPFGRYSLVVGAPIYIDANCDDQALELKRAQLTAAMHDATENAYLKLDVPK